MDNGQNSIITPEVEINKIIAEKETIIVQQQARIRCYKHEIKNLERESASTAEQQEEYRNLIARTERQIEEKKQELERVTEHNDLILWKYNKVQSEIDEIKTKLNEQDKEQNKAYETNLAEFNDLKEFFLSQEDGYEEAQALKQSNQELLQEIERLTGEYDKVKNTIAQEDKDMQKFEEMKAMKAEVDELEGTIQMLNRTMLEIIAADSESDESEEELIAPTIEELPAVSSNMDICKAQEEFKMPNVPNKAFSDAAVGQTQSKTQPTESGLNIIQSILIPNVPSKRKCPTENVSNVVQEKVPKTHAIRKAMGKVFEDLAEPEDQTHQVSHFFTDHNNMITSNQAQDMFSTFPEKDMAAFSGNADCPSFDVFSDDGMNGVLSPVYVQGHDDNVTSPFGTNNNAFDFS